jgi:acyl-coenzyme A thioesterase PaaI-like protein
MIRVAGIPNKKDTMKLSYTDTKNKQMLIQTRCRTHPHCAVCNLANRNGLKIEYVLDEETQDVMATFLGQTCHEGYPGILHGGVISAIFDGAMGNCLFALGKTAVTVEITTRFRHPVVLYEEAVVYARIIRESYPVYCLEAEMRQHGQIKATAQGKFYDQPDLVEILG